MDTSLTCVCKSLLLTSLTFGQNGCLSLPRSQGRCETRVRLPRQLHRTDQVWICSKTPKPHSNQANPFVENGGWGQTPLICGCSGPGVCGGWRFQGPSQAPGRSGWRRLDFPSLQTFPYYSDALTTLIVLRGRKEGGVSPSQDTDEGGALSTGPAWRTGPAALAGEPPAPAPIPCPKLWPHSASANSHG